MIVELSISLPKKNLQTFQGKPQLFLFSSRANKDGGKATKIFIFLNKQLNRKYIIFFYLVAQFPYKKYHQKV